MEANGHGKLLPHIFTGVRAWSAENGGRIAHDPVQQFVGLHSLEEFVQSVCLVSGALQVPSEFVEGWDGHLLLSISPWSVPNEVPD